MNAAKRFASAYIATCVLCCLAQAEVITSWGDGSNTSEWTIDQGAATITIHKGDGNTYKFYSETVAGNNTPGVINNITVDSTASGNFSILILHDDGVLAGASDLKRMNLQYAGGVSTVTGIKISADAGETASCLLQAVNGPVVIAGNLANTFDASAGGVTGSIDIGGDIATARQLKVGDMTGDITIGGDIGSGGGGVNGISAGNLVGNIEIGGYLSGNITLASLDGNLLLTQTGGSTHGGSVTIGTAMAPTSYDGEITCLARAGGNWTFHGDVDGELDFQRVFSGTMTITADLNGVVRFPSQVLSTAFSGNLIVTGNVGATGQIAIGLMVTPARVLVSGDILRNSSASAPFEVPSIHVAGSLVDPTSPLNADSAIEVDGDLHGVIAVNGSVGDLYGSGPEIDVASFSADAGAFPAIAVNYDGVGGEGLTSGASIVVDGVSYTVNTPAAAVYLVSDCIGDMNSDDAVDAGDGTHSTGAFVEARDNGALYVQNYPGLGGSRVYHGACNGQDADFTSADSSAFGNLVAGGCCDTPPTARAIGADFDFDYDVDLDDLLVALGNFGTTSGALRTQGDADGDGSIDLDDLLVVLGNFQALYCPNDGSPSPIGGGSVALSVDAFDTGGYTGGGFAGEDEHFVFDGLIEMSDPNDDWLLSLVCAASTNGAVFRLVDDPNDPLTPGNTLPEKYTTFFSVPYAVNAAGRFTAPLSGGGIAGACGPEDPDLVYTTTELDAGWYDTAANSHDGPAAVFRIVLDVSGVSAADTSGGLGSVYFSTTGPADPGHIEVASLHTRTGRKFAGTSMTALTGAFYVTD